MTTLAPVSVALKFGFLAVLYLFLLWVARSALRDLRGASSMPLQAHGASVPPTRPACTRPRPRTWRTSPDAPPGWWWSARRDTIPG